MGKSHGLRHTNIYSKWSGIKRRCLNQNERSYKDYGGRGIKICDEWIDNFQAFYDYVSKLEHFGEKGYSLDRIDVNSNYEPNNLRWADRKTQNRNRRDNIYVEYNGARVLLLEVAEITGISYTTLKKRIRAGDRGDKLFRPTRKMILQSGLVLVDNNQVLTTSLIIAEKFGRRHDNVLQAIENELANLREISAEEPNLLNFKDVKIDSAFIKSNYKDKKGEMRPMYYLNRDAFFQVALGFTGKEASKLRWNFIQTFNAMEKTLKIRNK